MVCTKHVVKKHTNTCFHTIEAKEHYDRVLSDMGFIPDKRFHVASIDSQTGLAVVNRVVAALNWTEFCNPRSIPDTNIVHKFYANLWANQATTVRVRGRIIALTAKAINGIFNLLNNVVDAYSKMLSEANDATFAQVLQTVVVEVTTWDRSGSQGAWSCE